MYHDCTTPAHDFLTGGYPKFVDQGFNENYVPVWLQAAGYNTYYTGKLFNAHTVFNYDSPHAAGWTGSDFLLDPYTYRYLNATFQRNHDKPVSYEGKYATDVMAEKALGFLNEAIEDVNSNGKPFFLTVAPTAPHSDVDGDRKMREGDFTSQAPPVPAERHKHLFPDVIVPRTPNFNPDDPSGAYWIAKLPKQNQKNIEYNDEWYRKRLRTLQAVDEMIDSLMTRLSEANLLDSTYIFYSTDNGYSIGQHRRQPGKQCAFEEDINIPFIVRGPGIPEGIETELVTSHTDLAPTFLSLAKAAPPTKFDLDGQAIPLKEIESLHMTFPMSDVITEELDWPQEHVNVEMWGIIMSEGKYGMVLYPNHTYKALRLVGPSYNLLYTIWCNNEHELYDMTVSKVSSMDNIDSQTLQTDPFQLVNLYHSDTSAIEIKTIMRSQPALLNASCTLLDTIQTSNASSTIPACDGKPLESLSKISFLVHRLDSLLMVLKTCIGRQCTHPWESLFPSGEVKSLSDALDSQYDDFFEQRVARVHFDKCERGYIAESEGPMWDEKYAYPMIHEVAL